MPTTQPPTTPPPDELDDIGAFYRRRKGSPWGVAFIVGFTALAGVGVYWLANNLEQRGLSVTGEGQIIVTPSAGTWVLLQDGLLARTTPDSVTRLGLKTSTCDLVSGWLVGSDLHVDVADCKNEESMLRRLGERLQRMGLKVEYWSDALERAGDDLDPRLVTPEIVGAMIDARFTDPQLLSIYTPLFPETLLEARAQGLAPPVLIAVKRNDFFIRRFSRPELATFLARDRFVVAAASVKGGWLVRDVEIVPGDLPPIERLLVAPLEVPWPTALATNPLKVSRRTAVPGGLAPDARPIGEPGPAPK